ncbi:hypothetical protein CI105_07600 [Candidatus Izimaplasma bacterium ZiA1]|uniref:hypothetical protein n=1 Tax=Candidatus Izimoplasma sp. ZiA1 TaxID=2024899 RepID=UPI000BAA57A4|nr:hypothetical protein CI105_07600 [Candidatus Izimaplasma bacterium ZiA1]
MDTYLYTQSDKSTTVYLDGTYMIFNINNSYPFQIRRKGKPKFKDIKLVRNNDDKLMRIFTNEQNYIEDKYINLYKHLISKGYKNVFISGYKDQVHVAFSNKDHIRKIKVLTETEYLNLKNNITSFINLANQAYEMINY